MAWYRKAAEQGHVDGQYALGDMYRDGNGVDQDHEESIKWLKRAAEQGDDFAQLELGDIYATGVSLHSQDGSQRRLYTHAPRRSQYTGDG